MMEKTERGSINSKMGYFILGLAVSALAVPGQEELFQAWLAARDINDFIGCGSGQQVPQRSLDSAAQDRAGDLHVAEAG